MARRTIALVVLLFVTALGVAGPVAAQETRQLRWDRLDVTIDLNQDGSFRVCEFSDITFVRGSFSTGNAAIPLDRVTDIRDVTVREGNQAYRQGNGTSPNTFRAAREGNELVINWAYPPTSNRSRSFEVCYTVIGGLRVYPDSNRLWWKAVPADRPFPVGTSTITVTLPRPVPAEQLDARAFAPGVRTTIVNPTTVRYEAGSVPANREVEIGLEFPRDVVNATPPAWQAAQEEAERREEQLQPYRDLANLGLGGLAILIVLGGVIGIYSLWHTRGRDLPVGQVAEYFREPPDDLPPPVVGTLIDERADLHDVLAAIPWLGSRGVLHIAEEKSGGILGIGASRDFTLQRLQADEPLARYEETLLTTIFGSKEQTRLSQLKGKLLARLPLIQQELYDEVIKRGFFDAHPELTRKRWRGFGFLIVGLAALLFIFVAPAIADLAAAIFLPVIALGILGIVMIATAGTMPRRTRAGALARAKWQAFGRYLANIERYEQLEQAREIFERYLPYATVFGLERSWVQKFARVGAPAPTWYSATPLPYEAGYGYRRRGGYYGQGPIIFPGGGGGGGQGRVEAAPTGGGGFDVQGTSDNLFGGLQGMSDGLLDMFDSAGRAFSSPPPSSGSSSRGWSGGGGGGGWSGGGGGGGGGGSRGFG